MSAQTEPTLDIRRFCSTEELADLFGFTVHWVYKLHKRGKGPPRLPGFRPYRYDTQSRAFRDWLREIGVDVGDVDTEESSNV